MLRTIIAVLMLASAARANDYGPDWSKSQIYLSNKPATSRGSLFWSTICEAGYPNRPCPLTNPPGMIRDTWNIVNVTDLGVPAEVTHVFVSGQLIISHANSGNFAPLSIVTLINSTGYANTVGKAYIVTGSQEASVVAGGSVAAQAILDKTLYVQRTINETANLMIGFRAFGDTTPIENNPYDGVFRQWYLGHAVEVDTGIRSNWSTWIPVKDGKFEMKYSCKDGHTTTNAISACGVNLTVQAFAIKQN